MSESIQVFVNERRIETQPGSTVDEVVGKLDEALSEALQAGAAYVTDGVGRRLDPSSVVYGGAIYRVIKSGSRAE